MYIKLTKRLDYSCQPLINMMVLPTHVSHVAKPKFTFKICVKHIAHVANTPNIFSVVCVSGGSIESRAQEGWCVMFSCVYILLLCDMCVFV